MNVNFETIKSTIGSVPKSMNEEATKVGGLLISLKDGIKTKCLEKDIFQKAAAHKDTIVGYGAFIAALYLAIKCLKEIVDKIKETKKQ